jgi:hypothetical protein
MCCIDRLKWQPKAVIQLYQYFSYIYLKIMIGEVGLCMEMLGWTLGKRLFILAISLKRFVERYAV